MSQPSRTSRVALVEIALVGGSMCTLLATRLPDVARYRQQREAEAEATLRSMWSWMDMTASRAR